MYKFFFYPYLGLAICNTLKMERRLKTKKFLSIIMSCHAKRSAESKIRKLCFFFFFKSPQSDTRQVSL